MNKLTVFGGNGFIGSRIMELSTEHGYEAVRGDWKNLSFTEDMGDIVYCLGVGDCGKPYDVINSHLNILQEILIHATFRRITYVSSTRVYMAGNNASENSAVKVIDKDDRKLFNLVKLTAEAMLEKSSCDYRIVRPSNVFGTALNSPLFLPSIIRDAIQKNEVNMFVPHEYEKDYVYVDDVASMILKITKNSKKHKYNIASGENTSAIEIATILQKETDCKVNWHKSDCDDEFPVTDINAIKKEFGFSPHMAKDLIALMIENFKTKL